MSKQKRIVCYAINGAGLGHVTRLLSVAKWMRRYVALLEKRPAEVLFLTSSDASDILAEAGFAAFKIPSKTVARKTELNKLEYRRLAKHFVWNTLGVFAPDLLVVDTFPSGSFDELFQVLDGPFKKSFIYRKVKPEYAARATFRSAASMYDTIVAPHSIENCPVEQVGGKNIRFSGEVVQFDPEDFLERDDARQQLGVAGGDRLVYLSAGGGGDPHAQHQLQAIVEALKDTANVHLLIGAGPLYRGSRISGSKITWFDGPAVGKYFGAVDGAICAAGYNTFHELMLAGVPTAFFAQTKIADDQRERIQTAFDVGACLLLENLQEAAAIESTLHQLLNEANADQFRQQCMKVLPHNGARQCALQLLAPLYDSERLEWAEFLLTPRLARRLEQLTGTASSISEWLVPLMPQDQAKAAFNYSSVSSVLGQLSGSAAAELRAVLATQEDVSSHIEFEAKLIQLFDSIEELLQDNTPDLRLCRPSQGESDVMSRRSAVAKDALKTILAVMKRNPYDPSASNWTSWVCGIVQSVSELLHVKSMSAPPEQCVQEIVGTLQLYRAFPRIVATGVSESFRLFQRFIELRRSAGEPNHQTSRALQVLKMTHSRVTVTIVEDAMHNFVTEADLHG